MENIDYYLQNKHKFMRAVPIVVSIMSKRTGSKLALKQPALLQKIREFIPKFNSRSLRWVIHEIRVKHLIKGLVADNYGYYIETDLTKILGHVRRLEGYIHTIREIKGALLHDWMETNKQKLSEK